MAQFTTYITSAFLFENIGVRNFWFVIRVLSFMFVPFGLVWTKVALVVIYFASVAFCSVRFVSSMMM